VQWITVNGIRYEKVARISNKLLARNLDISKSAANIKQKRIIPDKEAVITEQRNNSSSSSSSTVL